MPDYWQFPTVSMGLGPMPSIYQLVMKYLINHGLLISQIEKFGFWAWRNG